MMPLRVSPVWPLSLFWPRVDRAQTARGFPSETICDCSLIVVLAPLLALRGDSIATAIVAFLYVALASYGVHRLDNGERTWRKYWVEEKACALQGHSVRVG